MAHSPPVTCCAPKMMGFNTKIDELLLILDDFGVPCQERMFKKDSSTDAISHNYPRIQKNHQLAVFNRNTTQLACFEIYLRFAQILQQKEFLGLKIGYPKKMMVYHHFPIQNCYQKPHVHRISENGHVRHRMGAPFR